MTTSMPSTETTNQDSFIVEMSRQQPAWHVVILSMLSFSLYLVFWYFKTVKALKSKAEAAYGSGATPGTTSCEGALGKYRNANPSRQTLLLVTPTLIGCFIPLMMPFLPLSPESIKPLGLLIPIISLGFFGILYHDIATLAPEGSMLKANPSFPAFSLVVAMVFFFYFFKLPGAFFLLFTLVSVPAAIAQHWLNNYWMRVEPESALVRKSYSKGEMLMMLVGSMLLSFIVLGSL